MVWTFTPYPTILQLSSIASISSSRFSSTSADDTHLQHAVAIFNSQVSLPNDKEERKKQTSQHVIRCQLPNGWCSSPCMYMLWPLQYTRRPCLETLMTNSSRSLPHHLTEPTSYQSVIPSSCSFLAIYGPVVPLAGLGLHWSPMNTRWPLLGG